jgi:beta-glucosidase
MKCTKQNRLSFDEKAREILNSLSLAQKVSLMSGNVSLDDMINSAHYNDVPYDAGGLEEHGVEPVKFCDGPRGVVCGTGSATCFPVTMCRGASFDCKLEKEIGQAIGKEVRASGGNLFAGVCINLPYNPGWGRSQETYGEESFHIGEMGKALTEGVQEENVVACVKHFAFNQMEISRFKVDVNCDRRTEREVFFPHFKKVIDAGAASVMSSYNLYHGVHAGHNKYLLTDVLKNEWDFDGFIMSDFGWGITDTVEAANGGQDMEMCGTIWFGDRLVKAVEDGFVSEERIDDAALRIIRTQLAFQAAGNEKLPESTLACPEHIALARKSAEEGITLLKNENQVLPLSKDIKKLLVVGKLAAKENIGDHGSSRVYPPYVVTPLQGIEKKLEGAEVLFADGSDVEEAKRLAKEAEAVVFVVGFDHDDEGEFVSENEEENYTGARGGDRVERLGLHKDDIELIHAVAPENDNSVVVLIGGNMITMEEWIEKVPSVLMAYYPGMEGGNVIADILFGDVNPSGKLPYVVVRDENDLPYVNWDTKFQHYDYYHGYTKLEKEGIEPALPYGFGLSYTTFSYSDAEFSSDEKGITASVTVANTGGRDGDEVVQLYIGFEGSPVDRPVKILRGFERVNVKAGESKRVTLFCPKDELQWYDANHLTWRLDNMEYQVYIGSSSSNRDLIKGSVQTKF